MLALIVCLDYIFFTNIPYILFQLSLSLCVITLVSLLFSQKNKWLVLFLLMSFVFLNRYLFSFRFLYPVGTDMPFHYSVLRNLLDFNHHINFDALDTVSSAHPLLYVLYVIVGAITNLSFESLIKYLPPMLNMIRVLFYYLFVTCVIRSSPYRHKPMAYIIPALSTLILGWNYHMFLFGFEFRTEGLAVVFVTIILYLAMKNRNIANNLLMLIFVFATILTHFVSSFHLIVILFTIILATTLNNALKGISDIKNVKIIMIISIVVLFSYTLYQAGTFDGIISLIINKLTESDLQQYRPTSDEGVMAMYYGSIVAIGEWASRFFFIIGFVLYSMRLMKTKSSASSLFLVISAATYIIIIIFTLTSSILNASRIFNFFGIMYVFFITVVLFEINQIQINNGRTYKKVMKNLVITIFILFYVFLLVNKLPYWAINPNEIHSRGAVDDLHYESYNFDRNAVQFYGNHIQENYIFGNQRTYISFSTFSNIKTKQNQMQCNDTQIHKIVDNTHYIMERFNKNIDRHDMLPLFANSSYVYDNGYVVFRGCSAVT